MLLVPIIYGPNTLSFMVHNRMENLKKQICLAWQSLCPATVEIFFKCQISFSLIFMQLFEKPDFLAWSRGLGETNKSEIYLALFNFEIKIGSQREVSVNVRYFYSTFIYFLRKSMLHYYLWTEEHQNLHTLWSKDSS